MTSYIYDMVDTWNAGATTFTAVKMNVTDTASASGSLLMDLQVGGISRFSISKAGRVFGVQSADNATPTFSFIGRTTDGIANPNGQIYFIRGGVAEAKIAGGLNLSSDAFVRWSSSTIDSAADLFLSRRAAANLRLGAADAAAPVAQTLSVQSVVAGTTNTAGANLTITGSQGTGTGAGGSIIFQVAPAGSSGTAQNALATALTIGPTRAATFELSALFPNGSTSSHNSAIHMTNVFYVGWNDGNHNAIAASSSAVIGWSSSTNPTRGDGMDVQLRRDDANKLALRNGANNQELRVYGSYTSASVYDRLTLKSSSTVATIAAETDAGDMDLALTPAGTGNVRFGTHTGTADTAVSGYIEIKDAGGTIRKLAVIT